jgi:hypothetical protein
MRDPVRIRIDDVASAPVHQAVDHVARLLWQIRFSDMRGYTIGEKGMAAGLDNWALREAIDMVCDARVKAARRDALNEAAAMVLERMAQEANS